MSTFLNYSRLTEIRSWYVDSSGRRPTDRGVRLRPTPSLHAELFPRPETAQVGITIVGNPGIFELKCPEIKNRGSKGMSGVRISLTAASDLPAKSGTSESADGS
jgi:hypothetical protein